MIVDITAWTFDKTVLGSGVICVIIGHIEIMLVKVNFVKVVFELKTPIDETPI